MLPNIFDLSGKGKSLNPQRQETNCISSEENHHGQLTDEVIANIEKAEEEVWLGVKSEREDNLKLAIFHYRSAIKLYPEFAQAYHLLSNALKKVRQTRERKVTKRDDSQPKVAPKTNLDLEVTQEIEYWHPEVAKRFQDNSVKEPKAASKINIATDREEVIIPPVKDSSSLTTVDFSNVNTIPIGTNTRANNIDSSLSQSSDLVILPNLEISPSGDLVLEESLSVAKVYVEQALVFFEHKEWDKSIAACKEALRTCPNIGEAYKIWGNCLQRTGNSADAIGIYAKALELQPNMAEIYCNLGSIYAKSKKWQQAIEHYQKSTIIEPSCAAPYRNLAKVWDELGEYNKSEECFLKALEIDPGLISAKNHFDLAHDLAEENQLDKAIACYQNCIKIEPKYLNAYVRLAQILEKSGRTEEALYYYKKLAQLQTQNSQVDRESKSRKQIRSLLRSNTKKTRSQLPNQSSSIQDRNSTSAVSQRLSAQSFTVPSDRLIPQARGDRPNSISAKIARYRQQIQKQPNSPSAYIELGNVYFLEQQWQQAISCYQKGIKLAPNTAKYYINLGKAWTKAGDKHKANQAFYQGFSLEPNKVTAENHLLLGNKLLEQKQIKLAISCYRRAIILQPNLLEAYWQSGKIFQAGEKHQMAISCYQQALKVDPANAHSYFLLGNALTQVQQWQPAFLSYQKAAKIEPNNADIQHNLGEVLYQQEKWIDASQAYQKAIAINPDNSWSHNNLGNALLKLSKYQEAADSFRKAIKLKPDFAWSHYNLGEALSQLGQWEEALSCYKSAQSLDSELPEVKRKIGEILYQRNKQSQREALSFCMSQLAQDPDNIELYYQTISLNKQNHKLYLGLGKALVKQGKLDEAISSFQTGLKIQPKNLELLLGLNEAISLKNLEL